MQNKQKAEAAIQEIAENIPSKLEQNSSLKKFVEDLKDIQTKKIRKNQNSFCL